MGKPCVCGCESIKIDYQAGLFKVGDRVIRKGDLVSIDGATGRVMAGEIPMIEPRLSQEFNDLLDWADEVKRLAIRANADTPQDAKKAREFGAEGIGLCRTEHMFMAPDRLPIVQEMILAESKEERKPPWPASAHAAEDFYGILQAMDGLPVTIRLLDPPLHEFLPMIEDLLVEITTLKLTGGDTWVIEKKEEMLSKVRSLSEFNPMLGHRGCRLGINFPEVYLMQARAIFQAVVQLIREGFRVIPEVEIPLVGQASELAFLRREVVKVAEEVMKETGIQFAYRGTMIESPGPALQRMRSLGKRISSPWHQRSDPNHLWFQPR